MRDVVISAGFIAALALAGSASAQQTSQPCQGQCQSQSQTNGSQYQSQNNGQTYQGSYQVNGPYGAGQGQGTGTSQAEADYNTSSDIRQSPVSPPGSYQQQNQQINGPDGSQNQNTSPPITPSIPGSASPA